MIFPNTNLEAFFQASRVGQTSLLFIRERGCRYCEIAEAEMKNAGLPEALASVSFFECCIDDEPGLAVRLGLVGVPAFFKIDGKGRKKITTGFEGIERLIDFLKFESE